MSDKETHRSSTTTEAGETTSAIGSPEATTATTLLSLFTEMVTDATVVSTDQSFATEIPRTVTLADLRFSVVDYCVFGLMLMVSAAIGVYFGFVSKNKQDNTEEYLMGGKKMNFFPIAASLIASHISGITLMSIPAEMYANGTQYTVMVLSALAVGIALTYIYLPVFYELQLTSSFQYLEMRFDRSVRLMASSIYAISIIIFVPIVVYVPALAFSQVSGINLHIITIVTSVSDLRQRLLNFNVEHNFLIIQVICVFYTTFGGLKAVVWTDTLQFTLMIGAVCCVIVLGLKSTGGVVNVWKAAERGERLVFFK